jgi:hypothetical protein
MSTIPDRFRLFNNLVSCDACLYQKLDYQWESMSIEIRSDKVVTNEDLKKYFKVSHEYKRNNPTNLYHPYAVIKKIYIIEGCKVPIYG